MDLTKNAILGTSANFRRLYEELLNMDEKQQGEEVERRRKVRIDVMKDQCPRFYTPEEAQRQIDEISLEYLLDWYKSAAEELERRENALRVGDIVEVLNLTPLQVEYSRINPVGMRYRIDHIYPPGQFVHTEFEHKTTYRLANFPINKIGNEDIFLSEQLIRYHKDNHK